MPSSHFPPLSLSPWQSTRDTLHGYAKVLGRIRRLLSPRQKHWWHASLRVTEDGLTTAAIPAPERSAAQLEIHLNLQDARLMITSSRGVWWEMPVTGQPPLVFCTQILAALETMGIIIDIDRDDLHAVEVPYEREAVQAYGRAFSGVSQVMERFKEELPGETSQVQLWPHHFDLALLWLTGRKVSFVDPSNEEYADEQMSFGFSTGDASVPEAYFYVTAYPWPEGIVEKLLPPGASWYTQSWKGALLTYASLLESDYPEEKLLHFLRAAYLAGSTLMA